MYEMNKYNIWEKKVKKGCGFFFIKKRKKKLWILNLNSIITR